MASGSSDASLASMLERAVGAKCVVCGTVVDAHDCLEGNGIFATCAAGNDGCPGAVVHCECVFKDMMKFGNFTNSIGRKKLEGRFRGHERPRICDSLRTMHKCPCLLTLAPGGTTKGGGGIPTRCCEGSVGNVHNLRDVVRAQIVTKEAEAAAAAAAEAAEEDAGRKKSRAKAKAKAKQKASVAEDPHVVANRERQRAAAARERAEVAARRRAAAENRAALPAASAAVGGLGSIEHAAEVTLAVQQTRAAGEQFAASKRNARRSAKRAVARQERARQELDERQLRDAMEASRLDAEVAAERRQMEERRAMEQAELMVQRDIESKGQLEGERRAEREVQAQAHFFSSANVKAAKAAAVAATVPAHERALGAYKVRKYVRELQLMDMGFSMERVCAALDALGMAAAPDALAVWLMDSSEESTVEAEQLGCLIDVSTELDTLRSFSTSAGIAMATLERAVIQMRGDVAAAIEQETDKMHPPEPSVPPRLQTTDTNQRQAPAAPAAYQPAPAPYLPGAQPRPVAAQAHHGLAAYAPSTVRPYAPVPAPTPVSAPAPAPYEDLLYGGGDDQYDSASDEDPWAALDS